MKKYNNSLLKISRKTCWTKKKNPLDLEMMNIFEMKDDGVFLRKQMYRCADAGGPKGVNN